MLDIKIAVIGSVKNNNYKASIEEYLKRLRPLARVEVLELSAESFAKQGVAKAKKLETERLQEIIMKEKNRHSVLLCEDGKRFTSVKWAEHLNKVNQPFLFLIGGSLGFDKSIYNAVNETLSLSDMTMPHELARLVLMEQIYRAVTIINGKTYHY